MSTPLGFPAPIIGPAITERGDAAGRPIACICRPSALTPRLPNREQNRSLDQVVHLGQLGHQGSGETNFGTTAVECRLLTQRDMGDIT
jgi:hypothetical protein